MALSRRTLLKSGSLMSLGMGCGAYLTWRTRPDVAMLSACSNKQGKHFAALLSSSGELINQVSLPQRSHAAIFSHRRDEALFFSRRPGDKLFIFKRNAQQLSQIISAGGGRHFYGHGILVDEGKVLLVTENNYLNGEGVITLRDAMNNYRVMDEIPSYGIGPHELVSFRSGSQIAIANGGLRTHPDASRVPLNINNMRPNVSVVNWQNGELLQKYSPSNHRLSLRHLSVKDSGKIFVGGQLQGASAGDVPLVMTATADEGLRALATPENFSIGQKFYTASVCCLDSKTPGKAVVSFPKGNRLSLWDDKKMLSQIKRRDIAGVCQLPDQRVVYSTGTGEIGTLNLQTTEAITLQNYSQLRWDNHLISV